MKAKGFLQFSVIMILVLMTLSPVSVSAQSPQVLYAMPGGQTSGLCESWENACELQYALTSAVSGQEIWVAAGVYKPTTDRTDRTATFQLKSGVGLYGGFAGTETSRDQRNWQTNKTILSGDIDNNDINTDGNFIAEATAHIQGNNSYHIVTGNNAYDAILNGFIINAGQANGLYYSNGGGMINSGCNLTLTNITFSANFSNDMGGGMYSSYCFLTLMNVIFSANSAGIGGGMYNDASRPTLTNVTFSANSASYWGGGTYNTNDRNSTWMNIIFYANSSARYGGGMYNYNSKPMLANITFFANSASLQGGGMYNEYYSNPTLVNSILWGDIAPSGPEISNGWEGYTSVAYSIVQNGWPGTGNIGANPLFVGAANGNLHLQAGSPAIDSGTNDGCPTTDFDGTPRRQDGNNDGVFTCDMGAFEFPGTLPPNVPPIADAGGPYTALVGETITLDASNSYDPEGGLLIYEWDLDMDGEYDDATGVTTDTSFANTGNFTVGLRVTDTGSLSGTDTADVTINTPPNLPPVADAGGPYSAYKGETITLGASNSYDPEGGPLTYEWDLDMDGEYNDATGVTTDTSFAIAGNFTIGLRVTDEGGLSATDTADVTTNTPPLQWRWRPDMPTARYNMAAAISGDRIYVIGGDNYSCTPLTNTEEYDPATGRWTVRASMPTGRWGLGAATGPDGKIYVMGGMGGGCGSDMLTTVEAYNPATNSWETRADMPTQRISFSVAAATNGKIYVFGGEDYISLLATVEEYDPTTNAWTRKADMPYQNKAFSSAAAANGKIYIVGGDAETDKLWEYDPEEDSWTQRASIPVVRYGVKITQASDGRIYAVGGVTDQFFNTVESYDPLTNTWGTETSIKTPRSGHVVVAVDQYIFAIGGGGLDSNGNFTPLNSVEAASVTGVEINLPPVADAGGPYATHVGETITLDASKSYDLNGDPLTYEWDLDNDGQYDDATGVTTDTTFANAGTFTIGLRVTDPGELIDTDTANIINNPVLKWKNVADMPTPRWSIGAAVSGNKIYVIGGDNGSCVPLATVEEYDPLTNTWRARAPMPTGRWLLGVTTGPDGKIYAIGGAGGSCGSEVLGTVEAYDPTTESWETRENMPTPRMTLGVATATNGKIYAFGGEDFINGWLATVEEYDPITDTWTQKADMPYPNKFFSVVAANNGKIYIMDGDANLENVWEYDPTTDQWTLVSNTPTSRHRLAITQASNGQIYVIAGETDSFVGTVESYNITYNTWSEETSINTPRVGHNVVAIGDLIYVLGGSNGGGVGSVEAANVTGAEINLPPVAEARNYRSVPEGSSIRLNASSSRDPEGYPLIYEWDFDNDGEYDDATGVTPTVSFGDNGDFTIGLRVTDIGGLSGTDTTILSFFNRKPTVGTITAFVDPIKVGALVNASAGFTDPGFLDTHTAEWDWGDGMTSEGVVDGYSVSGSHVYSAPGVYTLTLTVEDDDGGMGSAIFEYVVVYDPNGGYVTGLGWINSPEGAYTPDPTLTGKATFGFVSKYQKGANVPTGNTEFQFHMANMNFKSTSYDWLVIAGTKAQYKGTSTVNSAGEYKFMLTVIDGSPDTFRIKIWDSATGEVIYDNMPGYSDNSNPVTTLGGGSIVIHKPK